MSGTDFQSLLRRVDKNISETTERIQSDVSTYISSNIDAVAREIANNGFATVPTFAGDYRVSREELEALVQQPA